MRNLNITAYKTEPDEYQMYYGKVSIKNGFYITNADETFYHLMGANTCYSMLELIHPEDVEEFKEAVSKMDEEPQGLIARLKCYNGKYRCMYMLLQYNGKVFEGFRSFDMHLCEVMSITSKCKYYAKRIDKYRKIMSLYPGRFFEYEFPTGIFRIYEYSNDRSMTVLEERLEEINERVQLNEKLTMEQKAEFQILYESLKKGRDNFKTCIDGVTLQECDENVRYEFRLGTLFYDDNKEMAVGLVTTVSEKQPKKSYYLSDNAFDAGTGLLNKRAIHEYAMDKIQSNLPGLYMVIMDVDDFKRINDTFGHLYGDEVLAKMAEIIKSVLRGRGMAGRFGGDEFMIVFDRVYSETDLRRILSTISKHALWAFHDVEGLSVTTSVGVSKYPEDGVTYDELFLKADKCLYIAKAKGKNRYIIYNEEKHGVIVKEDTQGREVGLKATVSDDKKNEAVSDLVMLLHREGDWVLPQVMKQMQMYFDIDGVAVYRGPDMERVYSVGKYVNPIQNLNCAYEEEYLQFFDSQGCYSESQLKRLENKSPLAYKLYTKQETPKFMQFAVLEGGKPKALVSFDFFNRTPKLGNTDSGLIRIVGRLMAQVAAQKTKSK